MLNKKGLIRRLARNTFLTQKETEIVLEELLDIVVDEISKGEDVNIVGFGKFYAYEHSPRPVRNPKTQEKMILKPYTSLKFKQSNVLKKLLKEKSYTEE